MQVRAGCPNVPAGDALPPEPPRVEDPGPDDRSALRERAAAYAAAELRERGFLDVVPGDALRFEVSTNGQRTRRVADIRPRETAEPPAFTITLTWAYYASLSWADFAVAIRHELVHAVEYVEHGRFSHGPQFRRYAAAFDTVADPSDLVPEVLEAVDHRYRLACEDCGFDAVRDKASAVVKRPEGRRCPDCGGGLRVRHTASGRTWTTGSGYRTARAAVERSGDVAW
jgi:predicted SprT family Zn-dependent metalloprotease